MRERLPLPQRIQNAPELEPGLELYYEAFHHLHSGRAVMMAELPISWMQIAEYGERTGLTEEQVEDLQHHVRAMDDAYLKWRQKQSG